MYSRAPRFLEKDPEPHQSLGPGAYEPQLLHKKAFGGAPFLSTEKRDFHKINSKFNTPAPGSYNIELPTYSFPCPSTSGFASKQPRFTTTKSDAPAPGSYNLQPQWVKSRPNTQPSTKTIDQNIAWHRVNTAPSIPNTRFGYLLTSDNSLVEIQEPTDVGFTAKDTDTVGPADYSPQIQSKRQSFSVGDWSKDSRRQMTFSISNQSDLLGSYDLPSSFKPPSPSKAPFSSSAPRFQSNLIGDDVSAAVGLYETRPKWEFESNKSGANLQTLGGRSKRFASINQNDCSAQNGSSFVKIPGRTGSFSNKVSKKIVQSFNSTSCRFNSDRNQNKLGPGEYEYSLKNFEKPKFSLSENGLGLGQRKSCFEVKKDTPAPGSYETQSESRHRSKIKIKKSFNVTSSRFQSIKSETPSSTKYNPKIDVKYSKSRPRAPFNTKESRFLDNKMGQNIPAPGTYSPIISREKSFNKKGTIPRKERIVFESKVVAPDPSKYASHSSFIKDSFNATLQSS
ncbi:hypothetical protein RCL1_006373 [Eukaryota sp. TZLM3-RCL]